MKNENAPAQNKPENPFVGLLFNIVLPVMILNQVTKRFGEANAGLALVLALALPIGYGLYDYFANSRKNYVSLFGVVNVAFTGGLAVLKLEGIWFAVKEAAFPLLLGIAVIISGLINKPFVKTMLWNPQVFDIDRIERAIFAKNGDPKLTTLFKTSNWVFALSFFLSSLLNFVLANRIFTRIDESLSETTKQQVLNDQIAQMTWQGYIVIALPLMILMMGLMWFIIRSIRKESGLTFEEIFKDSSQPQRPPDPQLP
ncbi:MAG: VC0807 family protein [Bdellovibrionota bacterium]